MSFGARLLAVVLLAAAAHAGTPGTFRGELYPGQDTKPGWVYIVGRNETLRLVHIANASVFYAEGYPTRLRRQKPATSLKPGTDVRVTAEQDANGNWQATEIEIIGPDARDRKRNAEPEGLTRPELQTRKN
jgi:hypothetical protein